QKFCEAAEVGSLRHGSIFRGVNLEPGHNSRHPDGTRTGQTARKSGTQSHRSAGGISNDSGVAECLTEHAILRLPAGAPRASASIKITYRGAVHAADPPVGDTRPGGAVASQLPPALALVPEHRARN